MTTIETYNAVKQAILKYTIAEIKYAKYNTEQSKNMALFSRCGG